MSENLKLEESLSALMDNEVGDLELRRILKELPNDSELEQKWDCYHLISAVLKQETHSSVPVDLLSGIRSQLESESYREELGEEVGNRKRDAQSSSAFSVPLGFRRFGQGMIAASVALGVLYLANTVVTPANNGMDSSVPFIVDLNESSDVNSSFDVNTLPEFNGDFSVFENSHVVSYDGSDTDAETAKSRLRQAVYEEFIRTNVQRNR